MCRSPTRNRARRRRPPTHGTYKRYMRAPHREFLALRGLAQRGKFKTEHRALNFIAKLGERGVVWHILTYWRPTGLRSYYAT